MTLEEFKGEYLRLANKFNTANFKRYDSEVSKLFYSTIKDMPASWFRTLVSNSIGDMKPIALTELRECMIRKRNDIASEREAKAIDRAKYENNGLSKIFAKFGGATSMSEAIDNAKQEFKVREQAKKIKGMG